MSVDPKSDAATRAEIASLDRMRNVSVGLQDARPIGRALRKSYVRTVADVWKVTERRTSRKASFERNSYSGVAGHEQVFPRYHRHSPRHACRAIRICSPHTIGRLARRLKNKGKVRNDEARSNQSCSPRLSTLGESRKTGRLRSGILSSGRAGIGGGT
jgi:hypothetical protein